MAPSKIPLPTSAKGKANKERHPLPQQSMGISSTAPSCSSAYAYSTKVHPLVPKYTAQISTANAPPQRTRTNEYDLTHTQFVQQAWDRTRSCSASMVSTAGPRTRNVSTGPGSGSGATIAERRHLSRIRSESLNTEYQFTTHQEQRERQQQHYGQQVQLQPPSLSDAESLSRLEVPLRQVTNNSNGTHSTEEFSPKTPVPGDAAVESGQDVGRGPDVQQPQEQQPNGSHGYRQEGEGSERRGGGMAFVETDLATVSTNQSSHLISESGPAVVTPNPATLRKCQSTHVCKCERFFVLLFVFL